MIWANYRLNFSPCPAMSPLEFMERRLSWMEAKIGTPLD